MKLVKWIKEKYQHRRASRNDHDPWWVSLMLDVGRPLVAVLILTMCAPGEHYLAVQAGWNDRLAWGMPAALTAYAGIAAVVATKRPKDAPGRRTAVWGAVLSVTAAMAAQPVAHLYGRTGLDREAIVLIIIMGIIPAAVFGHLLHMGAAAPKPEAARTGIAAAVHEGADTGHGQMRKHVADVMDTSENALFGHADTSPARTLRDIVTENNDRAYRRLSGTPGTPDSILSDPDTARAYAALKNTPVSVRPSSLSENGGQSDMSVSGIPDTDFRTDTDGQPDTPPLSGADTGQHSRTPDTRTSNVRALKRPSLSADVRAFLDGHPDADDTDLAAAMKVKWPDKPWDSVRKARDRYQEKKEQGA